MPADIADRDPAVLRLVPRDLDELPPALLGKLREHHPDDHAVVGWVHPQVAAPYRLLDRRERRLVERLDDHHPGLGHVERGQLVHRRLRSVIFGRDLVEHRRMRTPGADAAELLLGDHYGLLHLLLSLEDGLVNHSGSRASVGVPGRAPRPARVLPSCSKPAQSCHAMPSAAEPAHQGADPLAAHHPGDVAFTQQIEDDNRQVVVHTQANRRGVHDPEFAAEHLTVVQPAEADGARHLVRIRVIDPVDLGSLEHRLGADLERPLGRAGVGREERRAKASAEDHHAALLQVPDGPARDIGLSDLAHGDGRLHPGLHAVLLQHVLEGQAVDDSAEHAHVVGTGPVNPALGQRPAAEHVAATDDRGDLDALPGGTGDLRGDVDHCVRGDPQRLAAGEGLAGELDHNTVPGGMSYAERSFCRLLHRVHPFPQSVPAQPAWPIWNRAKPCTVTPCSASSCLTAFFGSRTDACSTSTVSLRNAFTRPSTILPMACSGLPSSLVICSAIRRSWASTSSGTSSRVTYRGRMAATWCAMSCPACGASESSCTSTPSVGGRAGSDLCSELVTKPSSNRANLPSSSFSFSEALASSISAVAAWPGRTSRPSTASLSAAPDGSAAFAISAATCWNTSVLATKSVSQLSSKSTPERLPSSSAVTRLFAAVRPARLSTSLAPLRRRISTAASKSSASTRAFLQSSMPAPVSSRSRFTSGAL